ncbi:hypothetical protein [Streptomyces sp. NPDC004658]|uniref:hypothetical protein n=1 Tax=Streptomyces sp. NPDC004658 TaxID=3154672 RepID=UPI0033A4F165
MEPVTVIASALAAGAAAGMHDSVSKTVRDAYDSLYRCVRAGLDGRSRELDSALADQVVVRESGSLVLLPGLLDLVKDAKAAEDEDDLRKLADRVAVLADAGQPTTVSINCQGVQVGRGNHQHNAFNGPR